MKSLLFTFCLFTVSFVYSQSSIKSIEDIRAEFSRTENAINQKKNVKVIHERAPHPDPDAEDAEAYDESHETTYYFIDGKIAKVSYESLYHIRGHKSDYYLHEGQVYFYYGEGAYLPNSMMIPSEWTETRIYYINEQSVRCLTKSYSVGGDQSRQTISDNTPNEPMDCSDEHEDFSDLRADIRKLKE